MWSGRVPSILIHFQRRRFFQNCFSLSTEKLSTKYGKNLLPFSLWAEMQKEDTRIVFLVNNQTSASAPLKIKAYGYQSKHYCLYQPSVQSNDVGNLINGNLKSHKGIFSSVITQNV